jgi:hypothetical protein
MHPRPLLSSIAGAAPMRGVVNAGFHAYARRRVAALARADPVAVQRRTLLGLLGTARSTRFGRDHGFARIRSVADFQAAVPLRTYDDLWGAYLRDRYPVFEDLAWPGRIPYLSLTSGTTTGATKYIPVSRAMLASNTKAARTMVAFQMAAHPASRLFRGRMFFLGGSTDLKCPAPGVAQGDLSGITAATLGPLLRPYAFPPLELALDPDWDRKLDVLSRRALHEPITLVSGVSSCLLTLFQRLLELTGESSVAAVWPTLEVVVHGGVKFDPYREPFRALLGGPRSGSRRATRAPRGSSPSATPPTACCAWSSTTGSSTSSSPSPSSAPTARRGTGWGTCSSASTTRSSSRPARGCGRTSSATRCGSRRCRHRS